MLSAPILGVLGAFFARRLLALMGAPDVVVAIGRGFTRVMLGGTRPRAALPDQRDLPRRRRRRDRDARAVVRQHLNIVLDPCLIFGLGPFPELGVTGAAVATTIGRGAAVLYQLWRSRAAAAASRCAASTCGSTSR